MRMRCSRISAMVWLFCIVLACTLHLNACFEYGVDSDASRANWYELEDAPPSDTEPRNYYADWISEQNARNPDSIPDLFSIDLNPASESTGGKKPYFSLNPNNYGPPIYPPRGRDLQRQQSHAANQKSARYSFSPNDDQPIEEIVPLTIWLQNEKEDGGSPDQLSQRSLDKRDTEFSPTFRLGKRQERIPLLPKVMVIGEKNAGDTRSLVPAVKLDLYGKRLRKQSPTHRLGKKDEEERGLWLPRGTGNENHAYGDGDVIPRIRVERKRDMAGISPTFRLG